MEKAETSEIYNDVVNLLNEAQTEKDPTKRHENLRKVFIYMIIICLIDFFCSFIQF